MKKLSLLLISTAFLLIFCGSSAKIGTPSTYTVVNDFQNAAVKVVDTSVNENTVTVEFSYSGENDLLYGMEYEVEILQDNAWYTLPYEKFDKFDIGYSVESGTPHTETYSLVRYDALPTGQYRIVIPVNELEIFGGTSYVLAAEFEIK